MGGAVSSLQPGLRGGAALRLCGDDRSGPGLALRQAQGGHPVQRLRAQVRLAPPAGPVRGVQPDALRRGRGAGDRTGHRSAQRRFWRVAGLKKPRLRRFRRYHPQQLQPDIRSHHG